MSNIVEIIKVIEVNLNNLNERITKLELEVIKLHKDVATLREMLIDDGK